MKKEKTFTKAVLEYIISHINHTMIHISQHKFYHIRSKYQMQAERLFHQKMCPFLQNEGAEGEKHR